MKKLIISLVLCFYAASAFADGNVCLYHTSRVERQQDIKENILSTIALVESGRPAADSIIGHPWPWTITYQGKGFYFDTKEEAIAAVKKVQKQGIESIDVGCMQVNLYYHGDAFASLEEAFDPKKNVEYAADFVTRLYRKHGTWGAAATAYHSHEPEKAYKYEDKLIAVWARLKKHLASGGRLYEEKAPMKAPVQVAEAKPVPAIIDVETAAGKKAPIPETVQVAYTAKPNEQYTMNSGAEFASQWRARKLTEYRLRRAEQNPVYRSNAVWQEGNL